MYIFKTGLKGNHPGLNIGTVNLYIHGYDQYSRLHKVTTTAGAFNYIFVSKSRPFIHKSSGNYSFIDDPAGSRKAAGPAGTNWTYIANNLNQYSALNKAGTVQNPTYDKDMESY